MKQDAYSRGVPDWRCPTPAQQQGTGLLKLELHSMCHEPSLADSPNSFSSDNLHKVHFLPLPVSPADGPPPQQQGFSERINQLTHGEKPFYQEGDQDKRDGGGSALGDTQYPTGQCPKQAALHDHTRSIGLYLPPPEVPSHLSYSAILCWAQSA